MNDSLQIDGALKYLLNDQTEASGRKCEKDWPWRNLTNEKSNTKLIQRNYNAKIDD